MDTNAYKKYAESRAKHTHCLRNALRAFWVGGLLCCFGQLLGNLYQWAGLSEKHAGLCVSVTLIFLAGLLTGIGWFDKIAKYAGAGTLVPITGFANSVASPAIDARADESDIIYPSQTNLHNSWGEDDSVQNKIGRRRGNYSKLTNKLKLPHERSDE